MGEKVKLLIIAVLLCSNAASIFWLSRIDVRIGGGDASAYVVDRWQGTVSYCFHGVCDPIAPRKAAANIFDQFDGDRQTSLRPAKFLDFYPTLSLMLSLGGWFLLASVLGYRAFRRR